MKRIVPFLVALVLLVENHAAYGQQGQVKLANAMQSIIDVVITPVGGQPLATITIPEGGTVDFAFNGQRFDFQVVPRDRPDTGFRQEDVNLGDLDGIFRLRGEFAQGDDQYICCWHCCRGHFGRTHRYFTYEKVEGPRGERTAVIFEATLKDGTPLSLRSPKMSYEDAMAPAKDRKK